MEKRGTRRVHGSSTFTNSKVSKPKRLGLGTKGRGRDDFKQTGRKACGEKRERQMQARESKLFRCNFRANHQPSGNDV